MHCTNCGAANVEGVGFCAACGHAFARPGKNSARVGYSDKIQDPAFARYVKNTYRWFGIFAVILAVAAIIGFYIYGETSRDMDNPQALFIGFGIGGMFFLIALFQIVGRKRSRTWDGCVVDKTVKSKTRRERYGHDEYRVRPYTEYTVIIREDNGRTHEISAEDDDTLYNYYHIGDRVRHHAGLNSYEKYDKSKDSIIFCNACATLCDINDDICSRCKCPLLK
jgi:hypothetical protein